LRKANSVAFDPDRGALPLTTRKFETCKSDVGFEGMRKDVNAMSAPSTNVTVVRNEKTPFSLCIVVCIVVDVSSFGGDRTVRSVCGKSKFKC